MYYRSSSRMACVDVCWGLAVRSRETRLGRRQSGERSGALSSCCPVAGWQRGVSAEAQAGGRRSGWLHCPGFPALQLWVGLVGRSIDGTE